MKKRTAIECGRTAVWRIGLLALFTVAVAAVGLFLSAQRAASQ